MKRPLMLASLVAMAICISSCANREDAAPSPFPATPKKPVTDQYHGIEVVDNYRWLDDLKDPAVRQWNDEQNRYTRGILDRVAARQIIADRLKSLYNDQSTGYYALVRRQAIFAMKRKPPKDQPFLVTLTSVDDTNSEKVIVDPNQLNPKGTTAIDFYVPSLDGRLVAVSLSDNGSEDGSVHVFEVATGKELTDVVPRVQFPTAGGDVAWNKDASGFYYTRYPQGDERSKEDANFYQQVYFHKLGTPASVDTYVIGRDFPRIAEIKLSTTDDGRYLLVTVANGDGGEFAHYLLDPTGKWTQVTQFSDKIVSAVFHISDTLYLLSRNGAPKGKILSLRLMNPKIAEAKTVVAESDATIQQLQPTLTKLYVADNIGGPSQIRVFDLTGKPLMQIPLKPISSVEDIVRLGSDVIVFGSQTFLESFAWYRFDPMTGQAIKTALYSISSIDFSDTEVVREFATSKDGTNIPLNIIRRKGSQLDGQNPTILYGYGGYGIIMSPSFSARRRIWLEQGGVYVVANLRGGGEYGEEWHKAGNLTKKQNVFDDFVACAQHLIDAKYSSPAKLAIEGGSNGGLLMGAVLTQHPNLFRAVVSYVGIYDMLRVELFPNGAFNVTEFGTVKDPEQFKALYAYSPYHHVEDGKAYPAVLFLTGDNDGRVDPANSRKMTARLQAATGSHAPVLLRTSSNAGHGIGTALSERIAEDTDVFAFLFDQLGVMYKPIAKQTKS
jgi:prolyl oligopeptidase